MSELIQHIQMQNAKIDNLTNMVGQLTALVMKDKVDTTWIDEQTAAQMFGMTAEWFRRTVKAAIKSNKLPLSVIELRHTNGRNYQYKRKTLLEAKNYFS